MHVSKCAIKTTFKVAVQLGLVSTPSIERQRDGQAWSKCLCEWQQVNDIVVVRCDDLLMSDHFHFCLLPQI